MTFWVVCEDYPVKCGSRDRSLLCVKLLCYMHTQKNKGLNSIFHPFQGVPRGTWCVRRNNYSFCQKRVLRNLFFLFSFKKCTNYPWVIA